MSADYSNSPTKRLRRMAVFRGLADYQSLDQLDRESVIRLLERADRAPRRRMAIEKTKQEEEAVC